jgi:drug/metabolite transporter (DMT)-like permease
MFSFILIGILCIPILVYRTNINKFHLKDISQKDYVNIFVYAILYIILSISYFYSSENSSNPGYTRLFYNTNVIITFLLASIILNSRINFKTILGVIIAITGLSMVILSKTKK